MNLLKTKLVLILIVLGVVYSSCNEKDCCVLPLPDCVQELIKAIEKEGVTNPPKEIYKWTLNDKHYYYVTPQCCDFFSELYDEECKLTCAPDGGFSGTGDGNCPAEIFDNELVKELIYKDER